MIYSGHGGVGMPFLTKHLVDVAVGQAHFSNGGGVIHDGGGSGGGGYGGGGSGGRSRGGSPAVPRLTFGQSKDYARESAEAQQGEDKEKTAHNQTHNSSNCNEDGKAGIVNGRIPAGPRLSVEETIAVMESAVFSSIGARGGAQAFTVQRSGRSLLRGIREGKAGALMKQQQQQPKQPQQSKPTSGSGATKETKRSVDDVDSHVEGWAQDAIPASAASLSGDGITSSDSLPGGGHELGEGGGGIGGIGGIASGEPALALPTPGGTGASVLRGSDGCGSGEEDGDDGDATSAFLTQTEAAPKEAAIAAATAAIPSALSSSSPSSVAFLRSSSSKVLGSNSIKDLNALLFTGDGQTAPLAGLHININSNSVPPPHINPAAHAAVVAAAARAGHGQASSSVTVALPPPRMQATPALMGRPHSAGPANSNGLGIVQGASMLSLPKQQRPTTAFAAPASSSSSPSASLRVTVPAGGSASASISSAPPPPQPVEALLPDALLNELRDSDEEQRKKQAVTAAALLVQEDSSIAAWQTDADGVARTAAIGDTETAPTATGGISVAGLFGEGDCVATVAAPAAAVEREGERNVVAGRRGEKSAGSGSGDSNNDNNDDDDNGNHSYSYSYSSNDIYNDNDIDNDGRDNLVSEYLAADENGLVLHRQQLHQLQQEHRLSVAGAGADPGGDAADRMMVMSEMEASMGMGGIAHSMHTHIDTQNRASAPYLRRGMISHLNPHMHSQTLSAQDRLAAWVLMKQLQLRIQVARQVPYSVLQLDLAKTVVGARTQAAAAAAAAGSAAAGGARSYVDAEADFDEAGNRIFASPNQDGETHRQGHLGGGSVFGGGGGSTVSEDLDEPFWFQDKATRERYEEEESVSQHKLYWADVKTREEAVLTRKRLLRDSMTPEQRALDEYYADLLEGAVKPLKVTTAVPLGLPEAAGYPSHPHTHTHTGGHVSALKGAGDSASLDAFGWNHGGGRLRSQGVALDGGGARKRPATAMYLKVRENSKPTIDRLIERGHSRFLRTPSSVPLRNAQQPRGGGADRGRGRDKGRDSDDPGSSFHVIDDPSALVRGGRGPRSRPQSAFITSSEYVEAFTSPTDAHAHADVHANMHMRHGSRAEESVGLDSPRPHHGKLAFPMQATDGYMMVEQAVRKLPLARSMQRRGDTRNSPNPANPSQGFPFTAEFAAHLHGQQHQRHARPASAMAGGGTRGGSGAGVRSAYPLQQAKDTDASVLSAVAVPPPAPRSKSSLEHRHQHERGGGLERAVVLVETNKARDAGAGMGMGMTGGSSKTTMTTIVRGDSQGWTHPSPVASTNDIGALVRRKEQHLPLHEGGAVSLGATTLGGVLEADVQAAAYDLMAPAAASSSEAHATAKRQIMRAAIKAILTPVEPVGVAMYKTESTHERIRPQSAYAGAFGKTFGGGEKAVLVSSSSASASMQVRGQRDAAPKPYASPLASSSALAEGRQLMTNAGYGFHAFDAAVSYSSVNLDGQKDRALVPT